MHAAYCPWNNSMVVKLKTDEFTFYFRPMSQPPVPNEGYVNEYIVLMLFSYSFYIAYLL